VTHAAIYIAITAGLLGRGGSVAIIVWAALAVIANMAQAQMYEYHRHHYATIVVKRFVPRDDPAKIGSPSIKWLIVGISRCNECSMACMSRWNLSWRRDPLGAQCARTTEPGIATVLWAGARLEFARDNTRFYAIVVCMPAPDRSIFCVHFGADESGADRTVALAMARRPQIYRRPVID